MVILLCGEIGRHGGEKKLVDYIQLYANFNYYLINDS